jgi:hypothetical protein
MKQEAKFDGNDGIPSYIKNDSTMCNGGTVADSPNDAIPHAYGFLHDWSTNMWGFEAGYEHGTDGSWGSTYTVTKKPGFCPGERVEWKHKIVADHNGVDALIVLDDGSLGDVPASAEKTHDEFGYFVSDWKYLAHDTKTRAEGKTKYYEDVNGQPKLLTDEDVNICKSSSGQAGDGVYNLAHGKEWNVMLPHCRDDIYRVSYFDIPDWLQPGQTYTFAWQYYGGVGLNSGGEMIQPDFSNAAAMGGDMNNPPEGAYFSQCIEIIMLSEEECGGASASTTAPTTTTTTTTTPEPVLDTTTPEPVLDTTTPEPVPGTTTPEPTPGTTTPEPTPGTTTPEPVPGTTTPEPVSTSGSDDKVALHAQCGGNNYSGSTTCVDYAECQRSNKWYSQCVPKKVDGTAFLWERCYLDGSGLPCVKGTVCVGTEQHAMCVDQNSRRVSDIHV